MSTEQPGLELDQQLDVQRRAWRIERIAWGALLAIIILAMLGLFGTGPISSTTAGNADDGLAVGYERFVRHDGRSSMQIRVGPDQVANGQVEVWIASAYLRDIEIEQVSPQPDTVRSDGDRDIFVFLADDPAAPVTITVTFRPSGIGRISGDIGIVGGPTVSLDQISYP